MPETTDPLTSTVAELLEHRLAQHRDDIRAFLNNGDVVSASIYADIVLHLVGRLSIKELKQS